MKKANTCAACGRLTTGKEPLERDLTIQEAADLLAVPVPTLNDWRYSGRGPAYCKYGKLVRYHPEDIRKFRDANRQIPAVQAFLENYGR